jgi:hypothetical protein
LHQTKNRRVGSDTKPEDEYRGNGEPRRLEQETDCMAKGEHGEGRGELLLDWRLTIGGSDSVISSEAAGRHVSFSRIHTLLNSNFLNYFCAIFVPFCSYSGFSPFDILHLSCDSPWLFVIGY